MALAQAQLLETPELAFQSYWVDRYVRILTEPPTGYVVFGFLPFDSGVIVTTNTGDNETLDLDLPAAAGAFKLVEHAMEAREIWRVTIIQFEALAHQSPLTWEKPNGDPYLQDGLTVADGGVIDDDLTLLSQFSGYVVDARNTGETLSLKLGSSLSPVGSQVPPRKFTTSRVGAPLRL